MKIVVTGAGGLIGWHAAVRIYAQNCTAIFKNQPKPYDLVLLDHCEFENDSALKAALCDADIILHFAGINRAENMDIVEQGNPKIAQRLIAACLDVGTDPHIIYANSIHAGTNTPYGRSKQRAAAILSAGVSQFSDLIYPHVFGECARPFYNNVTATFIDQIIAGKQVEPNKDGTVNLLYAGDAAQIAIDTALNSVVGETVVNGRSMSVVDLLKLIKGFHQNYDANTYPALMDEFDLALFNTYRAATYPDNWPRLLTLHSDKRGSLFEAIKSEGGGQVFLSTTLPGVTRGDHFHLHKIERFLVLQGQAIIRIRRVLNKKTSQFKVSGEVPEVVDIPTMHTHSIENVGTTPLLTLFWSNSFFDADAPDTYYDEVLK